MPWPLTTTRSVLLTTTIDASPDKVLQILHDPHAFLSLSPLVLSVSPSPSGPSSYTITKRLGFLVYFQTQTTFQCTLTSHNNGVDTSVVAGVGTRLKGAFRVKSGENGTSVLTEQVTIEGLIFLMPYIVHTMTQAQFARFSNLADQAEITSEVSRQTKDPRTIEHTEPKSSVSLSLLLALALPFCILGVHSFSSNYTSTLITFLGALSVLYRLNMTSDPYGLFHLTLNNLPGQDPKTSPETEWLNMGFWKDTDVFPQACRALALKLTQATGCKRGDRVLDVGHGTGESLLLLLSNPSLRPSTLTGITSLPAHHRRSQDRVTHFQISSQEPAIEVTLYACDAIYHPTAVDHPLDPSAVRVFDAILALDCAYHFNTRKTFLRQSFDKLAPGGRIGLADICYDPLQLRSRKAWLTTSLLRLIPKYNLVSIDNYILDMEEIGYVDMQVENITKDVFPGFIKFLKGRGWGWWIFGTMMQCYANAGAQFVIIRGSKASYIV